MKVDCIDCHNVSYSKVFFGKHRAVKMQAASIALFASPGWEWAHF